MMFSFFLLLGLAASNCFAQPVQLPQTVISEGIRSGACPSSEVLVGARSNISAAIQAILQDTRPPCPCGGPGPWNRIAQLDMSDPNQQCPSNWRLISTPVRTCGRPVTTGSCESAIFPSNGRSYSRVCGRIVAYQQGNTIAFNPSILGNPGLENIYIDGISLTHGAAGSRQHIWSFVTAFVETGHHPMFSCACTDATITWPYQVPSFIGDNYFCDTGNPGPTFTDTEV